MRSCVLSIQLNAGYVRAKHVQFHQNLEIRIAGSSGRVQNASPRKEPFLLAPRSSPLGTFREEDLLRLSDRNSMLMT